MLQISASTPAPGNNTPHSRWMQAGAVGAALSLLMISLSLIISLTTGDEGASEFFLLISPVPLVLLMLALDRRHRSMAPVLSQLALMLGILSVVGPLLAALLYALFQSEPSAGLAMGLLGLFGLWLIVHMGIGLRLDTQPTVLSIIGIVAGLAWIGGIGGVLMNLYAPEQMRNFGWFFSTDVLLLFTLYPLWVAWTGYVLWRASLRGE